MNAQETQESSMSTKTDVSVHEATHGVAARESAQSMPAQLLQQAIASGANMEQLERLLDVQQRWEANEARKDFAAAMAAFRTAAPVIEKNAEVDFQSQKGRTHYKHASLDHITAKVNPILGRHGLTYSWVTEQDQGGVTVHCDVMHVMGHRERVTLSGPLDSSGNKNPIQAIGSAVSYLQRYTLLSALGLSTGGQDDDGCATTEPSAAADSAGEVAYTITPEQAATLKDALRGGAGDTRTLLDHASKAAGYQISCIDDLPASMFDWAATRLLGKALKPYPPDSFSANFNSWKALIQSKQKTAEHVIATLSSRAHLSDEQKAAIRKCEIKTVEGDIV